MAPTFDLMSGELRESIRRNLSLFQYFGTRTMHKPGEILFHEGDPGNELFIIVEGIVELDSHHVIFDSAGPFEIIGEMAIIDGRERTATAQCATDVTVIRIDLQRFRWIIKIDTSFAEILLASLTGRIRMLNKLATQDPLTGAFSRGHFHALSEREFRRARRHETSLALAQIDIDHFKAVNDTYGHAFGDHVLQVLVDAAHTTFRPSDIFGRIGGEEFAVTFPGANEASAMTAVERFRETIHKTHIPTDGQETFQFTVSVGIAVIQDDDESIHALCKRADSKLYEAKRLGRDRVRA